MKTLNKQIPIFGGRLVAIIDKDLKGIEKKYNLTDTSDCDAIAFRNPTSKKRRVYVIAFEQGRITPGILAHEGIHIANMILDDIGYRLDIENDEIQCYVAGWVVDVVTEMLLKAKIKINYKNND